MRRCLGPACVLLLASCDPPEEPAKAPEPAPVSSSEVRVHDEVKHTPGCNPPWDVDPNSGRKVYKKECVK